MKQNYYVVTFKNNRTVFTTSYNEAEAIILSQACMIKNGFTYEIDNIRETRYLEDSRLTNFCV